MSVNESLMRNCYHPHPVSHIRGLAHLNAEQQAWLEKICPAGLFQRDAEGQLFCQHHGCLECGACRSLTDVSWQPPLSGYGITLRFG